MRLLLLCCAAALAGCIPSAPSVRGPTPELPASHGDGNPDADVLVRQTGSSARVAARPVDAGEAATPSELSRDEVSRRATEVFGARPEAAEQLDSGPASDEAGPSWDIEVAAYETHDRVEHYVRRFTGPARGWVAERLSRGTRYEPMIRERMRAGGVPEDMYYLALVESGFDPHAYSRAAAVGMWQFMASTAKGMGLRVDWWVDERRDPVRSTEAAVRFLASLHEQFGSLYLAAAAYNGGPGRVARGLTRFADEMESTEGEDRFFALSEQEFLPRETKEYVPQIIAAALIGKDPARYGMEIEVREPFAYDSVTVPALTSLSVVARAAGVDGTLVRDLNSHFIRGITAPRVESVVRIPVGTRARFDSAFSAIDEADRPGVRRERVEKAGSLAAIAKQFGTTAKGIVGFNPNLKRTKKGNLAAGQVLFVPTADVLALAVDVPDPSLEGTSSRGTAKYHVVKKGETLSHIAVRYGVSVSTLMRLNRLKKPMILIGQELAVSR